MEYNDWIDGIFNQEPTDEFAWDRSDRFDEEMEQMSPEQTLRLICMTFERSGNDLAPFSDTQTSHGIKLLTNEVYDPMQAFYAPGVSYALRRRTIESFVPLYRDFFVKRCDDCPANETPNPLNALCFMLWDVCHLQMGTLKRRGVPEVDNLCQSWMDMLENVLFLPHRACQESALHGLGHAVMDCYDKERFPKSYKIRLIDMIKDYLKQEGVEPKLREYAKRAKTGQIL